MKEILNNVLQHNKYSHNHDVCQTMRSGIFYNLPAFSYIHSVFYQPKVMYIPFVIYSRFVSHFELLPLLELLSDKFMLLGRRFDINSYKSFLKSWYLTELYSIDLCFKVSSMWIFEVSHRLQQFLNFEFRNKTLKPLGT